jgi:hypothetical protein
MAWHSRIFVTGPGAAAAVADRVAAVRSTTATKKQGWRCLRVRQPPKKDASRDSLRSKARRCPINVGISPIESLLAEKLWVADFYCTRFEVLGGLVVILRETADHAF